MKEYEIEIHATIRKKVKIKAHTEVQAVCSAEVSIEISINYIKKDWTKEDQE